MQGRISKIQWEIFYGWLFCCEQLFKMDETPDNVRVKLAAIHMEGKALRFALAPELLGEPHLQRSVKLAGVCRGPKGSIWRAAVAQVRLI